MPVITLDKDRFSSFVGRQLTLEDMTEWLPWLGVDIEEVGPDYVKIEFSPNRIDFSSYVGVARAFCGLKGWRLGLPKYEVLEGETVLDVDPMVSGVRPYVLGAIIRDLKFTYDCVRELMEMQEDIHWGVGRNRRKVSIGIHNLDVVQPPFKYAIGDPDSVKFVPLDRTEEMSLQEILERHEKGMAYRDVVIGASKYPLIIDSKGRVLSFPPIINSELTRVNRDTRNLFIDITGTDYGAVTKGLNVLVTALADMGGTLESVRVKYPDSEVASPNLTPQKMALRVDYVCELLGLDLSEAETVESLKKCRLDAKRVGKGVLDVTIPAYRIDIMHEVDLVEEVSVGYGFYKLKATKPATVTTGKPHIVTEWASCVRQIMVGLGFIEVMNFILTNETLHYEKMRRNVEETVRLANPVSKEYSITRKDLLPGLMKNLMENKHQNYPQRIFEVSDVIEINRMTDTRSERRLHVAGVSTHASANFTEVKSYVEALLANLGLTRREIKETEHPSFIAGRAAEIHFKSKKIGSLGEIHPEILNNFELENPICAFEMDLEGILKLIS